jgi:pimeloyl-ACP methyl ester carboxylesterase
MHLRTYGTTGPLVIVIHGGPGAPGHMAPVARGLAESFRVLEPWQRGSGGDPLTVATHVQDLHELVTARRDDAPPALVGSSWGAMLALAYAAAHPDDAGPVAAVGCGTFDPAARAEYRRRVDARTSDDVRARLAALDDEPIDADDRLRRAGDLLRTVYAHDLVEEIEPTDPCDARAHEETWRDMMRLQDDGTYPVAFAAITSPVLMLHGAEDPHPGQMIREGLLPHVPQLEYVEWDRCGHLPWLERHVRDAFYDALTAWLRPTEAP